MTAAPVITGRPLRAMAGLGLVAGVGLMLRLPILQRDLAEIAAGIAAAGNPILAPVLAPLAARLPAPIAVARTVAALIPADRPANTPQNPVPGSKPARRHPLTAPDAGETASQSAEIALPTAVAAPDYAALAYASLATGDRRTAVRLFDQALAGGPDPRRAQWQNDRDRLTRRWSGQAYALVRKAGIPSGPSASPILGASQAGANLAFTPDPLARRPLAIIARLNAALTPGIAIDTATTQAAIGIRWTPADNISLTAERLVAIGNSAANRFALRAAAGAAGHRGRAEWSSYGEATILDNGDLFAGAQARAALRLTSGRITLSPGAGAWASAQNDRRTIHRLDIGPSLTARAPIGDTVIELTADYRFRIAGNAAPTSGPTLTISTAF